MDITEILQECSHRSKDNLAQEGRGAQLVYTRERETQAQVGNSTRLTTRNKQISKNLQIDIWQIDLMVPTHGHKPAPGWPISVREQKPFGEIKGTWSMQPSCWMLHLSYLTALLVLWITTFTSPCLCSQCTCLVQTPHIHYTYILSTSLPPSLYHTRIY